MAPAALGLVPAIHVVVGSFWLGTLILNGAFLFPSLFAAGPASGGFQPAWCATLPGIVLLLGVACAVAVAVIGQFVTAPLATRLGGLGAVVAASGGPPRPEQAAQIRDLQAHILRVTRVKAVLLALAAAAMVSAKYL